MFALFFSGLGIKKPDSAYLPTYDLAKSAVFNVPPRKKKAVPLWLRYVERKSDRKRLEKAPSLAPFLVLKAHKPDV